MSLAEKFKELKAEKFNVTVITPYSEYLNYIEKTLEIFENNGFKIPAHSVIIYPFELCENQAPVSYHKSKLIMLFPLNSYEGLMYQYIHELCHIIIGELDEKFGWIEELLACSCNFFFFPKDTECFKNFIAPKILTFNHIKEHYKIIAKQLPTDRYLVYRGNHLLESALYSYNLEHTEFNYVDLLCKFTACQSDLVMDEPEFGLRRQNAIQTIYQIFED